MNHPLPLIIGLAGIILLGGCFPEERFWWSPDGRQAAVVIDHRLHLAAADGSLIGEWADPDTAGDRLLVQGVDWLPDGSGLAVHRLRLLDDWDRASAWLPAEECFRTRRLADSLPILLTAAAIADPDAESFRAALQTVVGDQRPWLTNAIQLAAAERPAEIRDALAEQPDWQRQWDELTAEPVWFVIHELAGTTLGTASDDGSGSWTVLVRSSQRLERPRACPEATRVAYLRLDDGRDTASLEVVSLAGGDPAQLARGIHRAFDWAPDGRSLVFMNPLAGSEMLLRQVRRVAVDPAPPSDPPQAEVLATALAPFAPRLQTLADGRILFAAQAGSLPVAEVDLSAGGSLFVLPVDGGAPRRVPTPAGALPTDLGFFVACPDGRRVAVVEGQTDMVAVVDLATGQTEAISPPHPDWQCRTLPAWRTADDLTFAAFDPDSDRIQWRQWNHATGLSNLSTGWPAEATSAWLRPRPRTNPAAARQPGDVLELDRLMPAPGPVALP